MIKHVVVYTFWLHDIDNESITHKKAAHPAKRLNLQSAATAHVTHKTRHNN